MSGVIDRLLAAVNAHDLDGAASLFHPDYRSEQPAHPARAFVGRAQMRANWAAMFAGVPDLQAKVCRSVVDDECTWTEWRWFGTRTDGQPFAMSGVTIFRIEHEQITDGQLYMEDVERNAVGIEQTVENLSGTRPSTTQHS
jgi:ketosteroid isomerase-like protein